MNLPAYYLGIDGGIDPQERRSMYKSLVVWQGRNNIINIGFNRDGKNHVYHLPASASERMCSRAERLVQRAGYSCRPFYAAVGYVVEKMDE